MTATGDTELVGRSDSVRFRGDVGYLVFLDGNGQRRTFRCDDPHWLRAFAAADGRQVTLRLDANDEVAGFVVHLE